MPLPPFFLAALLAIPRAFALLGLVTGAMVLAAVATLVALSSRVLITVSTAGGHASYPALARAILGFWGAAFLDAALLVQGFGSMALSLVVMGDALVGAEGSPGVLRGWREDRGVALGVLGVVALAPLVTFRRDLVFLFFFLVLFS
jgi:amino acid permease